jgi:hypothetical protein
MSNRTNQQLKAHIENVYTPLIVDPTLLKTIYSRKLSTVLLPLPFVGPEDHFTGTERRGEKTRFYFNDYQLFYDLNIGTHIGFKEEYYNKFGQTYYRLQYSPEYAEDMKNFGVHWRPPITMPKSKIRKWFPIQRMVVIQRKHIRGKMLYFTGPLEFYEGLDKAHWIAMIFLANDQPGCL